VVVAAIILEASASGVGDQAEEALVVFGEERGLLQADVEPKVLGQNGEKVLLGRLVVARPCPPGLVEGLRYHQIAPATLV